MIISHNPPPNFDEIIRVFPRAAKGHILFAYGDTIYNPSMVTVTNALAVHEQVHSQQQGGNPLNWWADYLYDPKFRLDAEVPAHLAEWIIERNASSRRERRSALSRIAQKLSSPLYRYDINKRQAIKLLMNAEAIAQSNVAERMSATEEAKHEATDERPKD